jgi:hypothetical protein
VVGRNRDADADAGVDDVVLHRRRMTDDLDHARGEPFGRLRLRSALQDGELVAAEPGNGVIRAGALAQPRRDPAQQFVADGMAQPVVDRLEVVEVDAQHRQLAALRGDFGQRFDHPVAE